MLLELAKKTALVERVAAGRSDWPGLLSAFWERAFILQTTLACTGRETSRCLALWCIYTLPCAYLLVCVCVRVRVR